MRKDWLDMGFIRIKEGKCLGDIFKEYRRLAVHSGQCKEPEDKEVEKARTCRSMQAVQISLDFIQRVTPLRAFKQGNNINKWVFLNEILGTGWKLDQRQGKQLEGPDNNPGKRLRAMNEGSSSTLFPVLSPL